MAVNPARVEWWGKVFFTDGARLTMNAGATAGSPDLYECETVETAGKLGCVLKTLHRQMAGQRRACKVSWWCKRRRSLRVFRC